MDTGNIPFLNSRSSQRYSNRWMIEKYGLKKIRFHDLRHTCASLLLSKGISIKQIQIWLGHSTYSTTAQEESATAMSGMFTRSSEATASAI